jgi:hypothetical protein
MKEKDKRFACSGDLLISLLTLILKWITSETVLSNMHPVINLNSEFASKGEGEFEEK